MKQFTELAQLIKTEHRNATHPVTPFSVSFYLAGDSSPFSTDKIRDVNVAIKALMGREVRNEALVLWVVLSLLKWICFFIRETIQRVHFVIHML
jgi:hypothetical protein